MELESVYLAVLSVCPAPLLSVAPRMDLESADLAAWQQSPHLKPSAAGPLTEGSRLPPPLLSAHLSSPSSTSKRKLMPKRSQLPWCALSSHLCPIIHFLFHPLPCLLCFIVPNTVSPVLLLELQEDNHRTTLTLTLIA